MDDPTILTGMAKIINKRKVNTKLNLDAIERDLIGGSGLQQVQVKDVDQELNELLQDIKTQPVEPVMIRQPPRVVQPSLMQPKPPTVAYDKIQQFIQSTPTDNEPDDESEDDVDEAIEDGDTLDDAEDQEETAPMVQSISQPTVPLPTMMPKPVYYPPIPPARPYMVPMNPTMNPTMHPTMNPGLVQQPQLNYAQEALQVYSNEQRIEESIIEQERLEDQKEKMIADIDELRDELNADGINTDRIPEVNMDSPYETVLKVYKQLKRKYDRSRCEDLGQGFILAAAHMVEMAFDGSKSYFGYRPDMTGWHRTVRSKMRRMKYEQSQLVSNALEYYDVGPISRMGLELVPSAFLYSLSRREQHGKDNYTPDQPRPRVEERSAALDDLRQFDN